MQIRTRLVLQFSGIVAVILLFFSGFIYYRYSTERRSNFYDRLKARASTTARLLVDVQGFDPTLLGLIDRNSLSRLPGEEVYIFSYKNEPLYASTKQRAAFVTPDLLDRVRLEREVRFEESGRQVLGVLFAGRYDRFVILAAATDAVGAQQRRDLRNALLLGLLGGVVVTVLSGFVFAGQALRPVAGINARISRITAQDLRQRLDEGNGRDELAELARNFNRLLHRLEDAFEQQRAFVSSASHELRTPLAALKTEIQVALDEPHSVHEHVRVLETLLHDTNRLVGLTNGLLQLARPTSLPDPVTFGEVRMEEVLLEAQTEVQRTNADYQVDFGFDRVPDDDHLTLVYGSEALLKTLFVNLIANACKYSPDHRAEVRLDFDPTHCRVTVRDRGIGLAPEDLPHLFRPFFRGKNAAAYEGFGIGLAVCDRIVRLHRGEIDVRSELGRGTEFIVTLPHF